MNNKKEIDGKSCVPETFFFIYLYMNFYFIILFTKNEGAVRKERDKDGKRI